MGIPVSEFGDRISAAEELQWNILETIEPWGPRREDFRLAILCWFIVRCHAKTAPAFGNILNEIDEILGCEPHEQTEAEMAATLTAMGGNKG